MLVETVSLTGHPAVGAGAGRSRPVGAERRDLSHRHGVRRGEGSQLGDEGPFWTLRRTYEQNTGKERGRMGRHGRHLLDSARPAGRCRPRTGGASCSQPPGPRVSGSKSGGAVSSGLFFFVNVYMSTYIYNFSGYAGSSLQHRFFSSSGEWGLLSICGSQAAHCGGISCAQAPGRVGSVAVAPGLQGTG